MQESEEFLAAARSFERLISTYMAASESNKSPTAAQQKDMVLRIFKRKNAALEEYRNKLRKITHYWL